MAEIKGNRAIEDAAIDFVLSCEREAGREPVDARRGGGPADIESPPRLIEVKATGKSSVRGEGFLWLETRQVEAARDNPDFYLYLVENVRQGDPANFTLRVLAGQQLQRLLSRAREKHYFELPLPVAEYDAAPSYSGAAAEELRRP